MNTLINASFFVIHICMGYLMHRAVLRLLPAERGWLRVVVMSCLLGFTFGMPSWIGDGNPLYVFLFFPLLFSLCYGGPLLPRLVVSVLFYCTLLPIGMVVDSTAFLYVMGESTTPYKLPLWLAFYFLLRWIRPRQEAVPLSPKLWSMIGLSLLAPLATCLSFSIWNVRHFDGLSFRLAENVAYTILPFTFLSTVAILFAILRLSRHEALEQENRLAALREVYFSGLKQEQSRLRTLRHDLNNHVTALQGLAEQGKQTELLRYLADLSHAPALEGGKRFAVNETANVVLCSKAAQMEELGLIPDFEAALPESLSVSPPELCALLGNALDNAIEGAAGADSSTITLRARLDKGVFMLRVQNAVGGKISPDLSTTKADASQHGYGLAGMREIALRHGGSLEASVKDGRFELLICFPCQEDKHAPCTTA